MKPGLNDEPPRKSHALTWVVSAFAVLVLYVASWPPIEIKARGEVELYLAVTNNSFPYVKEPTPAWVDVLYGPMDFLRGCREGDNPFNHYYWWWTERLRQ